jgi:WD40 repeat protein/energy-coupling factor transporter ATP-binding protein EcfA2
LDEDNGLVVDFARELRCLRERAGRPTYRELSSRAHFSTSALAEAAGGRRLPSLAVTVAFVRACEGDVTEWESRWRECAADLAGPAAEYPDVLEAPYAGLAAFRRGDADRFFGRARLVDEVVARVRDQRMVAVFGPSGSGKSSVLMAGLLPILVPDKASDRSVVLTPGRHPLEECAVRLSALVGASPAGLRTELAEDPGALHLCIRQAAANRPDDADFVLVVDQFEELFTLCEDPAERAAFVAALTTAATAPTSRTRVVLGVRADFYGNCGEYPELVDALRDGQILVGAMTADELREAITGPAEAVGCRVETALVSRLVSDATGQPGALPLVSHALRETWRRRRGTVLSLGAYEAAGGIHHALARTADAVYTELDDDRRQVAHQLFLRLTALGEGTDDTKRRVRRDELDESPATAEVLERLAGARLITVDGDGIEITHEALIRHWPRLRGWLDDDRDGLRVHRQLTEATQLWEAHDREQGSLLRGARLTQAENMAATKRSTLTDREREFLEASLAARTQEQTAARRRIRRTRQLVALLAILLVVASVSLFSAVRAQNSATAQRNAAVVGSVLSDANLLRDTNPALSLQLTLAAYRTDPTPRARDALLNALDTPYASRIDADNYIGQGAQSLDGNLLALPELQGTALWDISDRYRPRRLPEALASGELAAFGPDRALLLKTRQRKYEIWDLHDPRRPRQLATLGVDKSSEDSFGPSAAGYSADGRAAATIDYDGTARLWDLTDLARPRVRAVLMPAIDAAAGDGEAHVVLSPRGDRLVVANSPDSMQLWDITEDRPRRLAVLSGDDAAFTPDGRTLAVDDGRESVQLWDVPRAGAPHRLAAFTNRADVHSLAFSRGTGLLAVGDVKGSVSLWNVADIRHPVPLTDLSGQLDGVWTATFGPRGDTLVTTDHTSVRIWDLGSVLVSHPDAVTAVRLNHRGDLLATGGADKTVRLWHVDDDRSRHLATLGLPYQPRSLTISPDDRVLLVDGSGPTEIWDIAEPTRPVRAATLPETYIADSIAFNPKDSTVVITHLNRTTNIYDLADPYHPELVDDLAPYRVETVAFHPDGDLLGVGNGGYYEIWDPTAHVTSRKLAMRQVLVGAGTFGPDGRTLSLFHADTRETELLDIADPRKPALLSTFRPSTPVSGGYRWGAPPPAYFADGHRLAVLDGVTTVRLWDITDPRKPASVTAFTFGHRIGAMAVSPDGRQLFAATAENVVQRRYLDVEDVAKRICTIANPRISAAQWREHFQSLPYQPPCR